MTTKIERFNTALSGQQPDRPLVATWAHFLENEYDDVALSAATIEAATKYDWDWIKYNPRAIFAPEAWGNVYDYTQMQWVFPKLTHSMLADVSAISKFPESLPITENGFSEQIAGIQKVKKKLPDTPVLATIFSPLSLLLLLAGRPISNDGFVNTALEPMTKEELLYSDTEGILRVLGVITDALVQYVQALQDAGVDGVFYATTSTASLFTEEEFEKFSTPFDEAILSKRGSLKIILHTCGSFSKPEKFLSYPIEALSWDTHAEGNPGIDELKSSDLVLSCGVSRAAFDQGDMAAMKAQAEHALKTNASVPFLLAPDCAIDENFNDELLHEFRKLVN